MTAVEFVIEKYEKFLASESGSDKCEESYYYEQLQEDIKKAKAMDEKNIKDAIIYALDEDGHTGDWKIKFANDYYEKLKKEYK